MSNITKKIDRAIPVTERSQVFTDSDANQGDILLIETSLGKPARLITIQTDDVLAVRFNVRHTIFPPRDTGRGGYPNGFIGVDLAAGQDIINESQEPLYIAPNETVTLDGGFPVKDIQLVEVSGVFEIFVA